MPVTREFFFSMGDPSFGARKTREYENMLTKRKHNVNEHKNVKRHFQFTAKYIKIWGAEKITIAGGNNDGAEKTGLQARTA
ncbi:MAG: hypothetical protein IKS27_01075 [Oscillospiraceae bacterium]|nr:hypothetical protein [Oscillospiraceae bacterium]